MVEESCSIFYCKSNLSLIPNSIILVLVEYKPYLSMIKIRTFTFATHSCVQ